MSAGPPFGKAEWLLLGWVILYLSAASVVAWEIGRDWPAVGLAGFLVVPAGALLSWFFAAVEVVRAAMRAYREDWRKGVGGGVTALVLGLSPVAAGALNNTLRHAGALYQLESIDLQRLRRDCADLVSRLPPTARSRVIHIDNPAFARLPAGVRALNPLVVRVTRRYVEVVRYGMVARREGVIVVPAGRDYRPEHAGREFAVGVYRLNW